MVKELLLEIGLEEMPAHVVSPSAAQLKEKTEKFLNDNRLTFAAIKSYATPRRLAVVVKDLAEKQADLEEEVKGPAKKIALDGAGNWSKAAQGFVRGQGLSTDDIVFKEVKGTEYVFVNKHTAGKSAFEVLVGLKEVIRSLTFPTTMHWNKFDFEYIRPIHWIVALLDDVVIPFELLDVKTGRISRGHRFLGEEVVIDRAENYLDDLKHQFVIADSQERKESIVDQIDDIASSHDWLIDRDVDLLEEVNNIVEYPTAFVGTFDEKYLAMPEEVLVTSMKDHQRYFEVRSKDRRLLPYFISVRNGNDFRIENVISGNEKVLVARLEDAEFFYKEDQELSIESCVEKLKNVTFHEKIGSMYEKMARVQVAAKVIGETVGLSEIEKEDLNRASQIYKFDLVTSMVDEFPELQGIMGEKYALQQGEKPAVAKAIREHYLPISSEGELPESNVGAVLAIADKLDSLMTFFEVDLKPSGSNDPYALRRQSYGIIRIIADKQWQFPFLKLEKQIETQINENQQLFGFQYGEKQTDILNFIKGRIRQFLSEQETRYDVIDAVLDADQEDIQELLHSAQILKHHLHDENFKPSVEALTRVIHLAKKAEVDQVKIDPSLFENDAEMDLYKATLELSRKFSYQTMEENYESLGNLRPMIDAYFDQTMVMADDPEVRKNRLALLVMISKMARAIASLDELVIK